jgi:hypothetical protein
MCHNPISVRDPNDKRIEGQREDPTKSTTLISIHGSGIQTMEV